MNDIANITAGTAVTITLTSGDTLAGTFVSVNSKGVNIKDANGKAISRALSRVERVDAYTTPDVPADLFEEGEYGAADIAAVLEIDAYDLRVWLRAAGYGVGKGRRYAFDAGDATNVVRGYKADPTLGIDA